MRNRLSCLLLAVAVLSLGTMAFAQITVTETLFYNNTSSTLNPTWSSSGTTAGYACPGGTASPSGACTSVQASGGSPVDFTFTTTIPVGDTYVGGSATISAVDVSTGSDTVKPTTNTGWVAFKVATDSQFASTLGNLGVSDLINSVITDAVSSGALIAGSPNSALCSGTDSNSANTANPQPGDFDTTGCLYYSAGGPNAVATGFGSAAPTANVSSLFSANSTLSIFELISDQSTDSGSNITSTRASSGATELVFTYQYSLPPSGVTPEPATLLLLGTGLSFVASRLRRRNGAAK
jgi:hypothetical protein